MYKDIRETSPGIFTNGNNYFSESICEYCNQKFLARIDRKGKNKFCGSNCYKQSIERKNTFDLTEYQLEVIYGCLLSDGCITKTKRAKNYYFTHCSIHEIYSDFLMKEIKIPLHKSSKKENFQSIEGRWFFCKKSFAIRSPNSPTFTKLRAIWYKKRKIIPKNIEITPVVLLHWYLGDGTLKTNAGIILCTDAFFKNDNKLLIQKLNNLGFCASLNSRNRIFIPNKRVLEFLKYIGPPPVKCFAYKWDTTIEKSYLNRECKGCGTEFNTQTDSRYFCNHNCYMRYWRKNGPTLRVASRKEVNEEVHGSTANKVGG